MTSRVKTVACLGGVSIERNVPADEIHDYLPYPENVVWMDVQDPGPADLALLIEQFGFHPLALEDVAKGQQRPKVDQHQGYLFFVAYGVAPSEHELQTAELDLFIGRNYVVSIHRGSLPCLDEAQTRWLRGGEMLRSGVGFLVYHLMDSLIDAYAPWIDAIEREVEDAEIEMFTQVRSGDVQDLLKLKRRLIDMRRVLFPLRDTFQVFLRRHHSLFADSTLVYFQDVYNQILRLLDVLEIERDMIAGAQEAYLTVSSNQLNRTMKTMTVITVMVAVVSTVFGAWGMNFAHIPLSDAPGGFWLVIGGVIALMAAVLTASWRKGWL